MASDPRISYVTTPALQHDNPALEATKEDALAARQTAGFFYRSIYWNAAGTADVVDTRGVKKTVAAVAGGIYPLQNCGVVTGGSTTLAQGDFTVLFD